MNDTYIIYGIVTLFVILGGLLPLVEAEFTQPQQSIPTDTMNEELNERVTEVSSVNVFKIFFSIFKMFFWTFGQIPVFIDLIIFIPLRITLAFLIARNIWVGGGG